jgi:hypothetical protein
MAAVVRCQAVQQSDEMFCARCRLRWDVNDPNEPPCRAEPEAEKPKLDKAALVKR